MASDSGDRRCDGPAQLAFIERIRNYVGEHTGYEPIPGDTGPIRCPSLETPIGFLVPHQGNVLSSVLWKWRALNGPGIAHCPLALTLLIITSGGHSNDPLGNLEARREGLEAGSETALARGNITRESAEEGVMPSQVVLQGGTGDEERG